MPQVASGSVRPKITVVIPAVGEARNLSSVFSRLQAELHVIAIDGHSVDDTVAVARQPRPGVQIIQDRCGNENALACGFAAATGDIIAMVNADGSADPYPSEIPRFVKNEFPHYHLTENRRGQTAGCGQAQSRHADCCNC